MEEVKKLLNVNDVATQLACSKALVYKMYNNGNIRGIRMGKWIIRFSQEEVDRILDSWKETNYIPFKTPIVRKDTIVEE